MLILPFILYPLFYFYSIGHSPLFFLSFLLRQQRIPKLSWCYTCSGLSLTWSPSSYAATVSGAVVPNCSLPRTMWRALLVGGLRLVSAEESVTNCCRRCWFTVVVLDSVVLYWWAVRRSRLCMCVLRMCNRFII